MLPLNLHCWAEIQAACSPHDQTGPLQSASQKKSVLLHAACTPTLPPNTHTHCSCAGSDPTHILRLAAEVKPVLRLITLPTSTETGHSQSSHGTDVCTVEHSCLKIRTVKLTNSAKLYIRFLVFFKMLPAVFPGFRPYLVFKTTFFKV